MIKKIVLMGIIVTGSQCLAKSSFECYNQKSEVIPCNPKIYLVEDRYANDSSGKKVKQTKVTVQLEDGANIFAEYINDEQVAIKGLQPNGDLRRHIITQQELDLANEKVRRSYKDPSLLVYQPTYMKTEFLGLHEKTFRFAK